MPVRHVIVCTAIYLHFFAFGGVDFLWVVHGKVYGHGDDDGIDGCFPKK
jgi:hypothetical protein